MTTFEMMNDETIDTTMCASYCLATVSHFSWINVIILQCNTNVTIPLEKFIHL